MRRPIAQRMPTAATPHPAMPSRRAGRAAMSRADFIGLVAGWSGALVLILSASAFIRLAG